MLYWVIVTFVLLKKVDVHAVVITFSASHWCDPITTLTFCGICHVTHHSDQWSMIDQMCWESWRHTCAGSVGLDYNGCRFVGFLCQLLLIPCNPGANSKIKSSFCLGAYWHLLAKTSYVTYCQSVLPKSMVCNVPTTDLDIWLRHDFANYSPDSHCWMIDSEFCMQFPSGGQFARLPKPTWCTAAG